MSHVDWDAWGSFLASLDDAERALKFDAGEERFYRGHARSEWPLLPTLFRNYGSDRLDGVESDLFFEFQARARELHHLQLSDWDVLFFMRHHGVPTRLLDWTETLGIALYFAMERHLARTSDGAGDTPCIWILNPYKLNGKRGGMDLYSPKNLGWDPDDEAYYDYGELLLENPRWWWDAPLAIYPQQKPARMGAQRGWFTIHGVDSEPLEQQAPKAVRRVEIPAAAFPAAMEILRISGIDPYGIYADLDGLAQALVAKNTMSSSANQKSANGPSAKRGDSLNRRNRGSKRKWPRR